MTFAEELRAVLEELAEHVETAPNALMPVASVARALGVTRQMVWKWLRGGATPPGYAQRLILEKLRATIVAHE